VPNDQQVADAGPRRESALRGAFKNPDPLGGAGVAQCTVRRRPSRRQQTLAQASGWDNAPYLTALVVEHQPKRDHHG
jgi:hypothetical protein